jgi:hypothetical protein
MCMALNHMGLKDRFNAAALTGLARGKVMA